ncbi:MAG: hypothetical protein KatS3mg105_2670 [Gemmatales bacterium]|nr:MAG: hypothetical protein KatS3mg105_2670 [Gemmatales bacterium]
MHRRDFLRIGGSLCGLSIVDLLRLEATGAIPDKDAGKSAIFIFLCGGQSHHDTWDMKPENKEIGGEFKPIRTVVPDLQVCERMPKLAQQADKYTVLRNVSHRLAVHGPGQQYLRTGNRPLPSVEYPDYGAVVTKELPAPKGIPPYISLPIARTNSVVESAGYLGVAYRSFSVPGDPSSPEFSVRALATPTGIDGKRIQRRFGFMNRIDKGLRQADTKNLELEGMDRFYEKAYDVLQSAALRAAFELQREKALVRERYGMNRFGQACLLARRLVQAGARFVEIDFGSWDTHQDNFSTLKNTLLPPWDQGLAALLEDLKEQGMLDKTIVWSTGEFGRTPKINNNAGRDHWPRAMSMLLAGGGIPGGQVVGKTDKDGAEPVGDAYSPDDVAASFLRLMGIDHHKEYYTPDGRPMLIVREGKPIKELVG